MRVPPVLGERLELGGNLPPKNLRKRFQAVREKAGLYAAWQQDCMRHTFASCSLAAFGAEETVAALGHGDYEMLFRHYRALVTAETASRFFGLTPAVVRSQALPQTPESLSLPSRT